MTRSPARITTPPISAPSTSQSSVTFVPSRCSIASTMAARCGSESSNALVTWTWSRPFAGGALLGEAARDLRQQGEAPVVPDHPDEVAAGVGEPVAADVDEEIDQAGAVHPRVRDEAAHRRVARDRREQLQHVGPFAEPAFLLRLPEGGDRVGPCEFAWFRHVLPLRLGAGCREDVPPPAAGAARRRPPRAAPRACRALPRARRRPPRASGPARRPRPPAPRPRRATPPAPGGSAGRSRPWPRR